MSRANIIDTEPSDFSVTFALRNGTTRTYWYAPSDFFAISAGADPAEFYGSQSPLSAGIGAAGAGAAGGTSFADAVLDASDLGAL